MPRFFLFDWRVVRFIPRRPAAPCGPPSTQPVSWRTPRMCSRSALAVVGAALVAPEHQHAQAAARRREGEKTTRCMTYQSVTGFISPSA